MAFPFCSTRVRAGPGLLLITGRECSLHQCFHFFLRYLSYSWNATVMMVAKENCGCVLCVCVYVYLPHTLSFFQIRMLSKPFSWRASVTLVLGRSYEVTNNWGCALCGFLPPPILCIVQILHDLFADGSSIKAFKKIVCGTNYSKHRMQLPSWSGLKHGAELNEPGALGFL